MEPGRSPSGAPPRARPRARGVALQADAPPPPAASTSSAGPSRSLAAHQSPGGSDHGSTSQVVSRQESGPNLSPEARYDIIRPDLLPGTSKQSVNGSPVLLLTNYFPTRRPRDWVLLHYNVEFSPQLEHTFEKKKLLRPYSGFNEDQLGSFIFDGSSLYTTQVIPSRMREITTVLRNNPIRIRLIPVQKVEPGDVTYLQFFNILMRKCLEVLGLLLIGRHYYDSSIAIQIPQHRLQLWQGFVTTLREHDAGLLYGVGITHRALRLDTVLDNMLQIKTQRSQEDGATLNEAIENELIGTIVMTEYRRRADQPETRTYRVDEIAWDKSPKSTFERKDGKHISFIDYYREKYGFTITADRQPLLVSRRKARDIRRGVTDDILLVPELCRMTGLTPRMKKDDNLMKELGRHLFLTPDQKLGATAGFVRRLMGNDEAKNELLKWGVQIGQNPMQVQGRSLGSEDIHFRDGAKFPSKEGDFTPAFRGGQRMVSSVPLRKWAIIVPAQFQEKFGQFLELMNRFAGNMGFNISRPTEMVTVGHQQGPQHKAYADAIDKAYGTHSDLQMVFVVLPNKILDTYSAVKKQCYVVHGLPSQCMLATNLMQPPNKLASIATKMAIQMNAKLGGEPWLVHNPAKTAMVIGFDIYHGGARTVLQDKSIGAMVCTTTSSFGTYFSCVSLVEASSVTALSKNIARDVEKCCRAYQAKNKGELPTRILFYRDGVGEGQLYQIMDSEVKAITEQLRVTYGGTPPKFSFIVVSKRINTRLFRTIDVGYANPPPGTIVDTAITLPERWDFYLISQAARQGVVSPTNYNVIYDRQEMTAGSIQDFTYRLCYLYYNWTGTVAVPAVCQYAHKLAYLTGMATQRPNQGNLAHLLYFL